MFINFSDIPAHQSLFLDYLDEFENVERFYGKILGQPINTFHSFNN